MLAWYVKIDPLTIDLLVNLVGAEGVSTTNSWELYLRWNNAICETLFTEDQAGLPVYLDMDDDVLASVSRRLSVAPECAHELADVVRATLVLERAQSDVFGEHVRRLASWRRSLSERQSSRERALSPPPVVALLAVFALAAETMGSDDSYAVHAYYPRLAEVLHVDSQTGKDNLQHAYRSTAEELWRGLNDWLTLADGRYGVPTAYALTHRYVGLPLSQALIRAADRRHLTRMFRQFGLPPGSDLPPADMERMLDIWLQQVPCPASKNLQGLWQRAGARGRIAEIAATELLNWNSAMEPGDDVSLGRTTGDVRLIAQLRSFPKADLQLSFLAALRAGSSPDELRVLSAEGSPLLDTVPLAGGSVRPRSAADIDPKSLVEGVLHLADPRTEVETKRHPRRLVPLRRDERVNAFVECERVQLGEDFLLLVKDEGPLLTKANHFLQTFARPGFRTLTKAPGLPHGWVLIKDVQVLAAPPHEPKHNDLNALVPIISAQLTIAGGLKLPGNLRKWSSLCPPEIRAISQLGGELKLTLTRANLESGDAGESRMWQSDSGVLLVDLADQDLEDGDYDLELLGDGTALQRSVVRLRSSDSHDRWSWETAPSLGYNLGNPLRALAAERAGKTTGTLVRGSSWPHEAHTPVAAKQPVGKGWWSTANRPERKATPIVIASPDPKSCIVTGAHYMQLPPTPVHGQPNGPMTTGTCTKCGLVKRYPAWPRRSRWRKDQDSVAVDHRDRVANVSKAQPHEVSHDDALDALVHLGGGAAASLDRVASQVDPSALAVDSFRRGLEVLGHIDIVRDERLDVAVWAVGPPCVLEASDGSFFLSGAWSYAGRSALETAVEDQGGKYTYIENHRQGPTTWFIEDLTIEQIDGVIAAMDWSGLLPSGMAPGIVPRAASAVLSALPPLGSVADALHRVPMPGARRTERFDVTSATWEPVHTAGSPGAYRLESSFRTVYIFRSESDLDQHAGTIGTAQLVKHLEAHRMGRPLLGYYPKAQQLVVPLGADLPGLYGRAAVFNSGQLPGLSRKKQLLVYSDIPEAFASRLADLFAT